MRSRIIFYLFVAVIAALVYLRFKMEIAPEDRLWFVALVVVVFIALQFFKRRPANRLTPAGWRFRTGVYSHGAGAACRGRRSPVLEIRDFVVVAGSAKRGVVCSAKGLFQMRVRKIGFARWPTTRASRPIGH